MVLNLFGDNNMKVMIIDDRKKDLFIEVEGKKIKVWNGDYKCYTAEYCKLLGLPMLNSKTYGEYADVWLSTTRCKKENMPVSEGEEPVAFYKIKKGYCPLYKRNLKK